MFSATAEARLSSAARGEAFCSLALAANSPRLSAGGATPKNRTPDVPCRIEGAPWLLLTTGSGRHARSPSDVSLDAAGEVTSAGLEHRAIHLGTPSVRGIRKGRTSRARLGITPRLTEGHAPRCRALSRG